MPYQNISAELTETTRQEIMVHLQSINSLLPFLIDLSPEERHELPKMGDKSVSFVEKSLELASQNPNLVPPFISLEELNKDFALAESLRPLLNAVLQLHEKLSDTYLAVGSEAYTAALSFYNSAKSAAKSGVPGTDTVVNELGKRFVRSSKKSSSE